MSPNQVRSVTANNQKRPLVAPDAKVSRARAQASASAAGGLDAAPAPPATTQDPSRAEGPNGNGAGEKQSGPRAARAPARLRPPANAGFRLGPRCARSGSRDHPGRPMRQFSARATGPAISRLTVSRGAAPTKILPSPHIRLAAPIKPAAPVCPSTLVAAALAQDGQRGGRLLACPTPAARTRLGDVEGVTASISGRQPGRRRARYRVAKHSRSFGSPRDHFVANALTGMRLLGCQSARDRAGFYLSVVCGGDFSDVAHLYAEFAAERLETSRRGITRLSFG